MNLRSFNSAGLAAFRAMLADLRANPSGPVARELLEDPTLSEEMTPATKVEAKSFTSRRDAAEYLLKLFEPWTVETVSNHAGAWSWLSLYFFDEVCPLRGGVRAVRNDYTYVFEPTNTRHYYRHLLYIAWYSARIAKPYDRLFLDTPLSSLDSVTEEVLKRLFFTRVPCMFEVLDRLYWDEDRKRPKKGIVSPSRARPADLTRRLPSRMRQLEKTYDLPILSANQLIELLGDEFKQLDRSIAIET